MRACPPKLQCRRIIPLYYEPLKFQQIHKETIDLPSRAIHKVETDEDGEKYRIHREDKN